MSRDTRRLNQDWCTLFPDLAAGDERTRKVMETARWVEIPEGEAVFLAGSPCSSYLLVLDGSVRVQLIGEGGREALLYRVLPGQSCVLTTCCMLSCESYPAEGFTDAPVSALVITKQEFDLALNEAPTFRRFVFTNLGGRIAEIITRMEAISFKPVERRLATWLLARGMGRGPLEVTHQQIAVELGTVREVVSRHLKRFESNGLVRLGRSTVEVADPVGLQRLLAAPV